MSLSLMLTALAMGLAGSAHCAVMCGAASAGLTAGGAGGGAPGRAPGRSPRCASGGASTVIVIRQVISDPRTVAFHLGRVTGYALAGALAAALTGTLAWLSAHGQGLRPLWTVFHLGVLAWGLSLLVFARQPAGAQRASLWLWARISPWVRARQGLFLAGLLWVFMPCGLLWSALLVASLAGSPWAGALVMVIFATASSLGLLAVPGVLARLRVERATGQDWGTRLAGGLLVASALAALWMALGQRLIDYCT